MRKVLVGLFFIFKFFWAFAQGDCEQTLVKAQDEFNAGHFINIPNLLKPCMDRGFSREQRQRAFLLLTHTYLLLDDPDNAEDSYLRLLKANPEFIPDKSRDPIEVVYLSAKFTTRPIFSLYGKLGGNTSPVRAIHKNNITGEAIVDKYPLSPGWQGTFGVTWHLYNQLSVNGELGYKHTAYKKELSQLWGNDRFKLMDQQNWLFLPLSAKYYLSPSPEIQPYILGGYSLSFLFKDVANITTFKTTLSRTEIEESPDLKWTAKRHPFNHAIMIGGGINYKIKLNYVFAEFRYGFGMSNMVKPDAAQMIYSKSTSSPYISPGLLDTASDLFQYFNTEDYFLLDNLSISVGFIKPLYKPRKLKRAKTKAVLNKIKKNK